MATVNNPTDPLFFIQLNSNLYQIDCSDENSSERIWTLIDRTDQKFYQADPELSNSCEKISALSTVFYFSRKDGKMDLSKGQVIKDSPTSNQVETDHEKRTCINEFRFKIAGDSDQCIIGSPILVQISEHKFIAIGIMRKTMKGVALYRSDGSFFNPALIQGNDLGDQRGTPTTITVKIHDKTITVIIKADRTSKVSGKNRFETFIVNYKMGAISETKTLTYRFLDNNRNEINFNDMGNTYHSSKNSGQNENQFYNRVKQEFIDELKKTTHYNVELKQEKPKSPIDLLKNIDIPDFGSLKTCFKIEQSKGSITMSLNSGFSGLLDLNAVIECIRTQFLDCQPAINADQIFIDPQQITLPPSPQPELLTPPPEFKIDEGYAQLIDNNA